MDEHSSLASPQTTERIPERDHDAGLSPGNAGIAQVQQLAGDHDAVAIRLGFHLNVNLKGVCSIKHLSGASTDRSSSFEKRLQKTVEENFDAAACSLSLNRQSGSCEGCLSDSDGIQLRLVNRFQSRVLPNSLPQRNGFLTAFTTLVQVLLHQTLLVHSHSLIHEIDPILGRKVFHAFPPDSFLCPAARLSG